MKSIKTFLLIILTAGMHYVQSQVTYTSIDYSTNKQNTLSSFTKNIALNKDYSYRELLKDARENQATYLIGTKRLSSKKLLKILKKESRAASNYKEFEENFSTSYKQIFDNIDPKERISIFKNLQKSNLGNYIRSLPTIL